MDGGQTMTLELSKVAGQIDAMGQELAGRANRERQALPAARALLHEFRHQQARLAEVAHSTAGRHLACAIPGAEVLDVALPAEGLPERLSVIGVDGSQIYPDRHGLAFYFVVNVGSIVFCHGSGQAPRVATRPRVYYADDEVYPGGDAVTGDWVDAVRAVAEVQELADLAEAERADPTPCLGLSDGPLLFWLQRAAMPPDRRERLLADYLGGLDRLRKASVPVAGLVSRPHSAEVVALLYLAQPEPEARADAASLHGTRFRGLTDRALFGFLGTGERSALFIRGTGANDDFRARGHTIYFFYLNTGGDVARVEIPEWLALDGAMLKLVHAAVVEQCRFNNGYPYVLTRADEQAVIMGNEREILESMIVHAMVRHGLKGPELSRKAQQKQVARWRRR
jgi:hypothetical protein